jgi:hypothetical protein
MTDTTSSTPGPDEPQGDAPQGDAPQGGRERGLNSFDTSDLLPDLFAYGRELLDRLSARAAETTPKIRETGYNADQWVDDVKWFWENATNDAVRAAKYWRERFPVE